MVSHSVDHWNVTDQIKFHNAQYASYTPLMLAAANGHIDRIKSLCAAVQNLGHFVNTRGGWNDTTALLLAAKAGHVDVVRLLLSVGAKTDAVNNACDSPLHLASLGGHVEVVNELLLAGSEVTQSNCDGNTPAILAAQHGHVRVLELIHSSSMSQQEVPLSDIFEARNKDSKTALLVAAENGRDAIIEFILTVRPPEILHQTTVSSVNLFHLLFITDHSLLWNV